MSIIGNTVGTPMNPDKFAKPGKSAYEIAVEHGFEGTEKEWLESLVGSGGGGGVDFEVDETLTLKKGILSVNTTDAAAEADVRPITAQGVYTEFAVINALLKTI